MAVRIRKYRKTDAVSVGKLIADTFREFNLDYATQAEQEKLLGPFRYAHSEDPEHQTSVARMIDATWVWVAEEDDEVLGILRGSPGRLHSLFVAKRAHRRGIGRKLMGVFERASAESGARKITMQATLYAVPFYQSMGFKRSTGVRSGPCFEGEFFPYQPMKKVLET